jgi:hypothetical protein
MPLQSLALRTVKSSPSRDLTASHEVGSACSPTIVRRPKSARFRRRLSASWVVGLRHDASGAPGMDRTELCLSFGDSCRFARSVLRLVGPEGPAVCVLDSSLGVHQRSPLRQYRCQASTPGWAEARPSARSCQTPDAFRPCRSSRLRRFTPLDTLQVCCTLHPAMGFAMFPVCLGSLPEGSGPWLAFPDGATPFGASPSPAGRSASPRPDPLSPLFAVSGRGSARVATDLLASFRRSLDLRVLLHCEVRCGLVGVAAVEPPDAPLGLVPGWFVDALFPLSLRGAAVGWARPLRRPGGGRPWLVPPRSEDRLGTGRGIRGLPVLPRGAGRAAPRVWSAGSSAPRGFGPACVRRAAGPRGARRCLRPAGRPKAAARPRRLALSGPEGLAATRAGRVGRRPRTLSLKPCRVAAARPPTSCRSKRGPARCPRPEGRWDFGLRRWVRAPVGPFSAVPASRGRLSLQVWAPVGPFSAVPASRGRLSPQV